MKVKLMFQKIIYCEDEFEVPDDKTYEFEISNNIEKQFYEKWNKLGEDGLQEKYIESHAVDDEIVLYDYESYKKKIVKFEIHHNEVAYKEIEIEVPLDITDDDMIELAKRKIDYSSLNWDGSCKVTNAEIH